MKTVFYVWLLLLGGWMSVSCKKPEEPSFQGYIRFKLNGVAIECQPKTMLASKPNTVDVVEKSAYISGRWQTAKQKGSIRFEIFEDMAVSPRQYILQADKIRRVTIYSESIPPDGITGIYYAGDVPYSKTLTGSGQMTLVEITTDYLKGTFSAELEPTYSGVHQSVTDGEFHLRRGDN